MLFGIQCIMLQAALTTTIKLQTAVKANTYHYRNSLVFNKQIQQPITGKTINPAANYLYQQLYYKLIIYRNNLYGTNINNNIYITPNPQSKIITDPISDSSFYNYSNV